MTGQKVLFGLHIPKCAGTSILKAAQSQLPASQIYQATALVENFRQNRSEYYELAHPQSIRFFFGHHVYDEMIKRFNDVYLFTFLRDPVERHVSNFKFVNRLRLHLGLPAMPVEEYLRNDNSMCQFILSRFPGFVDQRRGSVAERAISVLSKFDYVGDLGTLPGFTAVMSEQLRIEIPEMAMENASVPAGEPGQEEVSRLIDALDVEDDVELYSAFQAAGGGGDNPLLDTEGLLWRRQVFGAGEYDFARLEDHLVNSLYWEYRDHGVLDQFLEQIPQKIAFLNKFVEKAKPADEPDETGMAASVTPQQPAEGLIKRLVRAVRNPG